MRLQGEFCTVLAMMKPCGASFVPFGSWCGGAGGAGGPGCGARGWWRGLAGLRGDAPSRRLACGDLAGGPPPTGTQSSPAQRAAAHRHTQRSGPTAGASGARNTRGATSSPQELGGVTTHGSVGRERNPVIPRASAMSEAQRAPGTPRDDPIKETTSSVDQPRPRRSERVTAPSRLASRAPEGASARGTCAYVGSGAPSRWAS